ncbi:hypothetical protein H920_19356 [Fukomys damarensis]|uniref:Uncharacterized protein n=1 Tax=Fukomys damarensis TaxID=885580 RepID=A0A091CNX9_FUKDA|nr:hypothetical protein H920_19356 [Fukomys damarensis]
MDTDAEGWKALGVTRKKQRHECEITETEPRNLVAAYEFVWVEQDGLRRESYDLRLPFEHRLLVLNADSLAFSTGLGSDSLASSGALGLSRTDPSVFHHGFLSLLIWTCTGHCHRL